jgi:hypothetical protein
MFHSVKYNGKSIGVGITCRIEIKEAEGKLINYGIQNTKNYAATFLSVMLSYHNGLYIFNT